MQGRGGRQVKCPRKDSEWLQGTEFWVGTWEEESPGTDSLW